jgi:hypothetical protein
MKTPGKKLKRKRGAGSAGMSFGELVRRLWQPEPEGLEPKAATEKQKKPAVKGKRVRKS